MGSAIGSFLNVCIYRLPQDISVAFPASYCPACRTPIHPYDNLPVVGYLFLRGTCRSCRAPISARYPMVEAATGLVAMSCALWLGYTVDAASLFVFFALLLSATLIDFEHKIIPNKITYPGTVLGVGLSLFRSDFIWLDSLTGIPVGAGLLLVVRFLGSLLFRKEAMGLGDVKLMAVIGAFAGWQAAILSIFLGSIVGTLYSIPLLIKEARTGRRTTHVISFGPFLAIGGLIAALAQDRIWTFLWPV